MNSGSIDAERSFDLVQDRLDEGNVVSARRPAARILPLPLAASAALVARRSIDGGGVARGSRRARAHAGPKDTNEQY